MANDNVHRTVHEMEADASADLVYALLADAEQWPLHFPPNVHVRQLGTDRGDGSTPYTERLRMWATANGQVKSWTSRRELDPAKRRIEFRQEVSSAPVESMGGTWIVEALDAGRSKLTLLHDFTVADDRPEDVDWLERATDTNSRAELENLRLLVSGRALPELTLDFEDSVHVDGPADAVYEFLERVQDWPERVPHVDRLDLTEPEPGVQVMAMDTRTADGSVHTTESVRVCFPEERRIVYKQTVTPALMAAHTGRWTVVPAEGGGVTVTSQHGVLLREEPITRILGEDADLETARTYVREALGRNSTATLNLAKKFAESAAGDRSAVLNPA